MFRIHLVQMYYNLAYYDYSGYLLEEPHFSHGDASVRLGVLRKYPEISHLLKSLGESYITALSGRLLRLVKWSADRQANVIVFPEYAVPATLLPRLAEMCAEEQLWIVAGSHRVIHDASTLSAYKSLGISGSVLTVGAAYTPVISPSGSVDFIPKLTRSRWETELQIPESSQRRLITFKKNGDSLTAAVLPCIDTLRLDSLGKEFPNPEEFPRLVLCPSYSPSTESFTEVGTILARHETLLAYVNSAEYGDSSFVVPEPLRHLFEQAAAASYSVQRYEEAILELDLGSHTLHSSSGTVRTPSCGKAPRLYPIIYQGDIGWIDEFNEIRDLLLQSLDVVQNNTERVDLVSGYLADSGSRLPSAVKAQLSRLAQDILPLFDGKREIIEDMFRLVALNQTTHPLFLAAERIALSLKGLTEFFTGPNCPSDEDLWSRIAHLKKSQAGLPKITSTPYAGSSSVLERRPDTFTADPDLLEAFQNRGSDLDRLREFFRSPNTGLMFLSGPSGIGKSDLYNVFFRKSLPDWRPIIIRIAEGGGTPKLLVSIAQSLGMFFDIDAIAAASPHVFKERALKIARKLASLSKAILVLDDVGAILTTGNGRDFKMFSVLLDALCEAGITPEVKIIVVSSAHLASSLVKRPGSTSHRLAFLDERYIERIIERDIRKAACSVEVPTPEILLKLAHLAHGHPLVAKLIAEVVRQRGSDAVSQEGGMDIVASAVSERLLSQVSLTEEETRVLEVVSVFRVPVARDLLFQIPEFSPYEKSIRDLSERVFLNFDGVSLEQHEVVKRHFRRLATQHGRLNTAHTAAASYFERLIQLKGKENSILECAELAHHLASVGEYEKAKELRAFVLEEIKPIAKMKYRHKDYIGALELFKILKDVSPHDPEILAYVARCHGRLAHWTECNQEFEAGVRAAAGRGLASWWIYRDWGQLLARYDRLPDAKEKLALAEKSFAGQNNPSLKATRAFMACQEGDLKRAAELYEETLSLNPYHHYTLFYYQKLLRNTGDIVRAEELKRKLEALEEGENLEHAEEYDLDWWDD